VKLKMQRKALITYSFIILSQKKARVQLSNELNVFVAKVERSGFTSNLAEHSVNSMDDGIAYPLHWLSL